MIDFFVGLIGFLFIAFLLYALAIKLYWSVRFATYRLVDFVRSRKNN